MDENQNLGTINDSDNMQGFGDDFDGVQNNSSLSAEQSIGNLSSFDDDSNDALKEYADTNSPFVIDSTEEEKPAKEEAPVDPEMTRRMDDILKAAEEETNGEASVRGVEIPIEQNTNNQAEPPAAFAKVAADVATRTESSAASVADNIQREVKENSAKKSNSKIIIFAVALLLIIGGVIAAFIVISNNQKKDDTTTSVAEEEEEIADDITFGSKEHGYVTVPSGWISMTENVYEPEIGYSDSEGKNMVILNSTDLTLEMTALNFAENQLALAEQAGEMSPTLKTETISDRECFHVSYFSNEMQKWVNKYVFEAGDLRVHYIQIIVDDENSEIVQSISGSWVLANETSE